MKKTRIKCSGRRRLEVSYKEDTSQYEIVILQEIKGEDRYIATLVLEGEEFKKLKEVE